MFKYERGNGFVAIDDFLWDDSTTAQKDALEKAGYLPFRTAVFGGEFCGFQTEVYCAASGKRLPFEYIVTVCVGDNITEIAVETFPDLVELLGKLAPISQSAQLGTELEEREENERRAAELQRSTGT